MFHSSDKQVQLPDFYDKTSRGGKGKKATVAMGKLFQWLVSTTAKDIMDYKLNEHTLCLEPCVVWDWLESSSSHQKWHRCLSPEGSSMLRLLAADPETRLHKKKFHI